MSRLATLIVIGTLIWTSTTAAQTTLTLKFPDGQKSSATVKSANKSLLVLANERVETSSEQEMVVSSENGKRAEDGTLKQSHKIDSLKASLTMPGGVGLKFDSAKPDEAKPGTQYDAFLDLIKANSKSAWTVIRDKDNRVVAVEGQDKVLDSLDEEQKNFLKRQVDANYLRDQANEEMDKIPQKPLSKGDTWELNETMRLEAGQNLAIKTKYTYQGSVDHNGKQLHQIDMNASEVKYSIDADAPTKLASSNLKVKTVEGVMFFDTEKGQVVESRETIHITGELKFNINGMELAGEIDLTMTHNSDAS